MKETFWTWNIDTWIQTWTPQVDNFSKELSDFLLDDKLTNKEQITNLLVSNSNLRTWFENFLKTANLRQKIKCKKELYVNLTTNKLICKNCKFESSKFHLIAVWGYYEKDLW